MRIFPFTLALVMSILLSTINALPQPSIPNLSGSIGADNNIPNPIDTASNLANRFGQIPQDISDLGLSQMENVLKQAKQIADVEKNSGLLQNFVPRIDNMINKVRALAKDLTLGISEFGFKSVLGLPSNDK